MTRAEELRGARQKLLANPQVEAVDVLPDDDRFDAAVLEVVARPSEGRGVPSGVLERLGSEGVKLEDCTPRGNPLHYVIVGL